MVVEKLSAVHKGTIYHSSRLEKIHNETNAQSINGSRAGVRMPAHEREGEPHGSGGNPGAGGRDAHVHPRPRGAGGSKGGGGDEEPHKGEGESGEAGQLPGATFPSEINVLPKPVLKRKPRK